MIDYEMTPDGQPDYSRVAEWVAACNRCGQRKVLAKCEKWLVGAKGLDAHFCPRCERWIARELLVGAFGESSRFVRVRAAALRVLGVRPEG